MFKNFENHDRFDFPKNIIRVTAGHGGEALLILGSQKTALYDCGMAYCGNETVLNMEEALKGRDLDYVIISHTHYDHIGGLPYIKKRWPKVIVCGAAYGQKILQREGALRTIRSMGVKAEHLYGRGQEENITVDNMSIDKVLQDGEEISLGEEKIIAIEAKGHTDCSLAYFIKPWSILIASESTGILEGLGSVQVTIIKSYEDSMEALKKCRSYHPKTIISPHYGVIPQNYSKTYWSLYEKEARQEEAFISSLKNKNLKEEDMIQAYVEKYWKEERSREQPMDAFILNTKCRFNA